MFKGVGNKTAQRMALELIGFSTEKVTDFSNELIRTKKSIRYCEKCYFLSLNETCYICNDVRRDSSLLCVVADPKDVLAIEQSNSFNGRYHVLGGLVSPLDGMYPEMLRLNELKLKLSDISEVILALSPTVEGDTTGLVVQEICQIVNVPVYKLAQGIPIGADLSYLDEVTIDKAFQGKVKC
tara:strand:- start:1198 stop:1743 length:546 start_codon:yes stop_codon:yes gene_type:complete